MHNNYKTYLVVEFRTNYMYSNCKIEIARCEIFQIIKNTKPYKSGNILVHRVTTSSIKLYFFIIGIKKNK